eukprot:Gregarina_sp_Poly_1__4186@NODE_2290_length_2355_cov_154_671766_g1466_i0_p1_GENE_NODE_2290_length_2355_cov_154_671766_g1466_i0NODE_2290_length_2355_cov_154_671766_g1466_i0_p1_ORF_typecomplete_len600_score98_35PWI/PF01480_17/3_2e20_NODE_2290_length_2355_cov_154_671766_g1466_i03112110
MKIACQRSRIRFFSCTLFFGAVRKIGSAPSSSTEMAGTGPGFYRGTTHEQTPFFENKEAKMIEEYEWPRYFKKGVDFNRVSLDVIKYWISKQVTAILGFEDDIVIDFVLQQLLQQPDPEDEATLEVRGEQEEGDEKKCRCVDPRKLTFSLTGFMKEQAFQFVSDLWRLLLSAQDNPEGIPKEFAEAQEQERQQKLKEAEKIRQELAKLQAQQNGTAQDDGRNNRDDDIPDRFSKRDRSVSPLRRNRRRHGSRSPSTHYDKRRRRSPGRWSPRRSSRRGDDDRWSNRRGDWDRDRHYERKASLERRDRDRDFERRRQYRDASLSPPPRRSSRHRYDVYEGRGSGTHRSSRRSPSYEHDSGAEAVAGRSSGSRPAGKKISAVLDSSRRGSKDSLEALVPPTDQYDSDRHSSKQRRSRGEGDDDYRRGSSRHFDEEDEQIVSRRHEGGLDDDRRSGRYARVNSDVTAEPQVDGEDIIVRRPHRNCYMDEEETPRELPSWRKPSHDKYRTTGSDEEGPALSEDRNRQARDADERTHMGRSARDWNERYSASRRDVATSRDEVVDEGGRGIGRTSSEERLRRLALRKVKRLRGNESPAMPVRDG